MAKFSRFDPRNKNNGKHKQLSRDDDFQPSVAQDRPFTTRTLGNDYLVVESNEGTTKYERT